MVLGHEVDFVATAEWVAAFLFVTTVVTVPLRFVWFLVQRHSTPLRTALRPFEMLVMLAAMLAMVAAVAYGGWVVVEGWGLLWLLAWLLPAAAATAATPVVRAV